MSLQQSSVSLLSLFPRQKSQLDPHHPDRQVQLPSIVLSSWGLGLKLHMFSRFLNLIFPDFLGFF